MIFDKERLISALSWMLIHSLWQGLLFAVAGALILTLARKAPTRLRYNIFCSLLCFFILAAIFTFFRQMQVTQDATLLAYTSGQAEQVENMPLKQTFLVNPVESFTSFIDRNVSWIAIIWVIMFCLKSFGIIRQFGELYKLKNYRIAAVPYEWSNKFIILKQRLGINKGVAFLESQLVTVPCVVGFLRPVVLIPVGLLTSLPPNEIEAILLHELAHIKRRDFVMNLFQTFAETLFFFNPALLWLSSLIREERENCCDDIALSISQDRPSLVRALLSVSQGVHANSLSAAFSGRKNLVLRRAQRILGVKSVMINHIEKSILSVSILFFTVVIIASTNHSAQKSEMSITQFEDLPKDFDVYNRQLQNDMILHGIINDTAGMSYKLSREDFIVNGQLQPWEIHQKFKTKYMKYRNMSATFYNWKFEE